MSTRHENVGVAFALVAGAAAATALGASVVFFPSIVKLASRRVLAASLGFAGGVMSYVSFVEIFQKSRHSFESGGHEENMAYLFATLSFFFGVTVMLLLNAAVSVLLGGQGSHSHKPDEKEVHSHSSDKKKKSKAKNFPATRREIVTHELVQSNGVQPCCCASNDPVGQLERLNQMADVLNEELSRENSCGQGDVDSLPAAQGSHFHDQEAKDDNLPLGDNDSGSGNGSDDGDNEDKGDDDEKDGDTNEEQKRLVRMGINTAVAIGLHNFPEGLATFVAAIDDPRVGSVLALAIAIHNIPEGLCVALPIFYATGNRRNAFMWALLSGASELLAALLGWAVLASVFSDNLYGVVFGMVAGMMVVISIRELVPTAHFYDPEDTVVTYSFIGGMILIAFSLVLFLL